MSVMSCIDVANVQALQTPQFSSDAGSSYSDDLAQVRIPVSQLLPCDSCLQSMVLGITF